MKGKIEKLKLFAFALVVLIFGIPLAITPGVIAGDGPAQSARAEAPQPAKPGGADAPAQKGQKEEGEYSCPMHPEVRSKAAGSCPKCGMRLTPVSREHAAEGMRPSP